MSLEAIKKVARTEEEAAEKKTAAVQTAKKMVADAEKNGRAALETARREAEDQAKALMAEAERQAAGDASAGVAKTQQECQGLKQQAAGKLEEAAALIVRRVVNI